MSSIGFSVFSLCWYVLGFYKNPVVNKSSYFYGSHCLLRRVCVPATQILPGYIPHGEMAGASGLSHLVAAVGWYADGDTGGKQGKETATNTGRGGPTSGSAGAAAGAGAAGGARTGWPTCPATGWRDSRRGGKCEKVKSLPLLTVVQEGRSTGLPYLNGWVRIPPPLWRGPITF